MSYTPMGDIPPKCTITNPYHVSYSGDTWTDTGASSTSTSPYTYPITYTTYPEYVENLQSIVEKVIAKTKGELTPVEKALLTHLAEELDKVLHEHKDLVEVDL